MKLRPGTDGWRGRIAREFTYDSLGTICAGLARWLKQRHETPHVMLGYDQRFMGQLFAEHAAIILGQMGCKVFLSPSFASTPMLSMATFKRQAQAGMMITASHNPFWDQGVKLKAAAGHALPRQQIDEIQGLMPSQAPVVEEHLDSLLERKQVEYYDMKAVYLNHCRELFDIRALRSMASSVVYDAMYGAGSSVLRRLLPSIQCIHHERDVTFRGLQPEPTAENLHALATALAQSPDSWGIATDGDADRLGVMLPGGRYLNAHHVILLLIQYLVTQRGIRGKVFVSFSCSERIQALCRHHDLSVEVTPIGFQHIGQRMLEEGAMLGGEESGGIALKDHVPDKDGIFAALSLMSFVHEQRKPLEALLEEVYELVGTFSYARTALPLPKVAQQRVMDACASDGLRAFGPFQVQRSQTLDGYKFFIDEHSWVLLRPSGTEPVLRLYAESESAEKTAQLLSAVSQWAHRQCQE